MLYSLCIKCKKKVPYRVKRCEECQKEHNKLINKRNEKYRNEDKAAFYRSYIWRQLREQVLKDNNYICAMCKSKGIVSLATEVHHIEHLSMNWEKRLDYDNLIPLCYDCHHKIHEYPPSIGR